MNCKNCKNIFITIIFALFLFNFNLLNSQCGPFLSQKHCEECCAKKLDPVTNPEEFRQCVCTCFEGFCYSEPVACPRVSKTVKSKK